MKIILSFLVVFFFESTLLATEQGMALLRAIEAGEVQKALDILQDKTKPLELDFVTEEGMSPLLASYLQQNRLIESTKNPYIELSNRIARMSTTLKTTIASFLDYVDMLNPSLQKEVNALGAHLVEVEKIKADWRMVFTGRSNFLFNRDYNRAIAIFSMQRVLQKLKMSKSQEEQGDICTICLESPGVKKVFGYTLSGFSVTQLCPLHKCCTDCLVGCAQSSYWSMFKNWVRWYREKKYSVKCPNCRGERTFSPYH